MALTQENIWQPFEIFAGEWKGKGGGEPGIGEYERTYKFIFNHKFLEIRNKSTYPPSENNPTGEIHEDIGYISYDRKRKCFVLRQFHIEGIVNQYKLESISADGRAIIFVSEAIENFIAGFQARETYQINNENEFIETFELAQPGQPFSMYTSVTLHRTS